MNTALRIFLLAVLIIASSCGQKKDTPGQHENAGSSGNQTLYDRVMDVHDEVMPKMNDLHKAKTNLQTRLALPGTSESEKEKIEQKIARIDSASEGMMVWMRQFDPPSDSAGEEQARAYLEAELVKVEKVRQDILTALETAGLEE